jgi:hypothetical protein
MHVIFCGEYSNKMQNKKYHTVRTIPKSYRKTKKYHTAEQFQIPYRKTKKYQTVGTILKTNLGLVQALQ